MLIRTCQLVSFALAAFAVLSYASASPAPNPPAQVQFQRVLNKIDAAEKRRDITAWTTLLRANAMPNFKFSSQGRAPTDMKQNIAEERMFLTTMQSIDIDTERIQSFDVSGNRASVIVRAYQVANIHDSAGQLGPQGALHRIAVTSSLTYSLIRSNETWKIQSVAQSIQDISVDGRHPHLDVRTN